MKNNLFEQPQELARKLGLNWQDTDRRAKALGITTEGRAALREFLPVVEANLDEFLDDLYGRFGRIDDLAPLIANPEQLQRLKASQRRYILSLVGAEIDWDYALARLRIGAVHHQVRLTPQWLLLTYAHIVGSHAELILAAHESAHDALPALATLVNTALFDAMLILDSYGMAEERSLASQTGSSMPPNHSGTPAIPQSGMPASLTRLVLTNEAVSDRRLYAGLTEAHCDRIRTIRDILPAVLPQVLQDFYDFFTSNETTAALVPREDIPRLQQQVSSYWHELTAARFDRLHASSRIRVGVVHERIRLSPQWYMIGLAKQVNGILRGIAEHSSDPAATAEAFLRATFLDIAFVIDAYMEARAQRILHGSDFASTLFAGLSAGVVVIDGDHRVVSVNRTLVNFLSVDPALLYQVPVEQALPLPELPALLNRIANGAVPRAETTVRLGNRPFRATAFLLDTKPGIRGRPAAVVLDDLTDMLRLASEVKQDDDRLVSLFRALDMVVWEMEPSTGTLEVISTSVLALLGLRDVHFLGRPQVWYHSIEEADRPAYVRFLANLAPGERGSIEHRMRTADGRELWVRSSMRHLTQSGTIAGTTVDITAERMSEQHRLERDRANAESKAKSEFLAMMSHEVRTSLQGVLGIQQHLLTSGLTPQSQADLEVANHSAHNLLRLLDDLIETAALNAGELAIQNAPFDLVDLIEKAVLLFAPAARAKGLQLQAKLPADLPTHWNGDVGKLRQILVNLLNNSVKYTQSGRVVLRVNAWADRIAVSVEDTSPGVPAELRGAIFEAFHRRGTAGGSGLGLALSRRLAILMGGDLVLDEAIQTGTRFTATVPLLACDAWNLPDGGGRQLAVLIGPEGRAGFPFEALAAANWIVTPNVSKNTKAVFLDDPGHTTIIPDQMPTVVCWQETAPVEVASRPRLSQLQIAPLNWTTLVGILDSLLQHDESTQKLRVLVAEDDTASQQAMRLFLQRLGMEADLVPSGFGAIERAARQRYDVILLDLHMPDVDGLEAARTIRRGGLNGNTPILAMTGHAFLQDEERCRTAGIRELMVKPVNATQLAAAIKRSQTG